MQGVIEASNNQMTLALELTKVIVNKNTDNMRICHSGMNRMPSAELIFINVAEGHPLIQLAKTVQWEAFANLVVDDLRKTPFGKWWLGRKLKLRIHLGIYLLQHLFNKADRQIEHDI